jgi:hypothetical protein
MIDGVVNFNFNYNPLSLFNVLAADYKIVK